MLLISSIKPQKYKKKNKQTNKQTKKHNKPVSMEQVLEGTKRSIYKRGQGVELRPTMTATLEPRRPMPPPSECINWENKPLDYLQCSLFSKLRFFAVSFQS